MEIVYLRTGSVVSSQLGEPDISVRFDVLGVRVRQTNLCRALPPGRERGALDRHMPPFGKASVSAEAKKISVTALVQMQHQKACQ